MVERGVGDAGGQVGELALAADRQYMLEGVFEDVDPDADPLTDPLPDDVTADDVVTVDPPATDDVGGGAPGEAISDSVEEAHDATTPDEPAEIIDIDDVPNKK